MPNQETSAMSRHTPIQDRAITHSALSDDGSNQPWEISSKERWEKPVIVE
jgi:hypothetical protein